MSRLQMATETCLIHPVKSGRNPPPTPISKKGFEVAISGFRNVLSIGPDEQASNPWAKFILETEIARQERETCTRTAKSQS
jgi:hypothetical protein